MRALFAAALLCPLSALAAEKLVVAVLYFDNNTTQREYDVLQKGLADMLVTDLSGVETLQVVEREKLQALLDELKLQKTSYFDPKTAQRLGKGIGARYAVTGSMQAVDPELRIDIRLIEVATAKVVMADKVVGLKDRFFELEQALVEKFVGGLNVRLATAGGSATGVKSVAALLDYSKGVDRADRGDLQGASKQLADLVKASPDFKLAKARYVDVLRRLREAGKKRQDALSAGEQALSDKIARELGEKGDELRHLAYRELKGHFLLARLRKRIGPPNSPSLQPRITLIRKEDRPAALELMKAYFDNGALYVTEAEAHEKSPKKERFWRSLNADHEDEQSLKELGLEYPPELGDPTHARQVLAEFAIYGTGKVGWSQERTRPTLAELDKAYAERAVAWYGEAQVRALAAKDPEGRERLTVELLDQHAEALVFLKRKEEALPRWQEILDTFPKTTRYAEIENKLEQVLGISKDLKELEAAIPLCDTVTNTRWMMLVPRLILLDPESLFPRAEALVSACPGKAHASWMPRAVFQVIAQAALDAGECELFARARERVTRISEDGKNYLDSIGKACAQ
ncbi:MAG: CsgG/HfaB family protein [Myxococcaceae bacterium]